MSNFDAIALSVNKNNESNVVSIEEKIYCTADIDDDFEEHEVLIAFKNNASVVNKNYTPEQLTELFNVDIIFVEDLTGVSALKASEKRKNFHQILSIKISTPGKQAVLDAIKIIEQHEDVLCAEPNFISTLEENTDMLKATVSTVIQKESFQQDEIQLTSTIANDPYRMNQEVIGQMQMSKVWDITTGSPTVRVGVLDTGIDRTHPDLVANLDTSLGADFTVETNGNPWHDPDGHGTHVAGIIGAVGNNGIGITGVCWNIKLVSIKIYSSNADSKGDVRQTTNTTKISKALNYAYENNIYVVNQSGLDEAGNSTVSRLAILGYDGVFVCLAGNSAHQWMHRR